MADLYTTEKIEERKRLCDQLQGQITTKQNEKKRLVEVERAQFMEMVGKNKATPKNVCPHGKMYTCAHCKKTYPRKYLSTTAKKSYC